MRKFVRHSATPGPAKRAAIALLCWVILATGCAAPLPTEGVTARVSQLSDSALLVSIDAPAATYYYVANATLTRKDGVVRITFHRRPIPWAGDDAAICGIVASIGTADREVRLTDGQRERVIWQRGQRSGDQRTITQSDLP